MTVAEELGSGGTGGDVEIFAVSVDDADGGGVLTELDPPVRVTLGAGLGEVVDPVSLMLGDGLTGLLEAAGEE